MATTLGDLERRLRDVGVALMLRPVNELDPVGRDDGPGWVAAVRTVAGDWLVVGEGADIERVVDTVLAAVPDAVAGGPRPRRVCAHAGPGPRCTLCGAAFTG